MTNLAGRSAFIVLLIVSLASCGRILPWGEPIITYPNSGWVNQIDLFLSFETALPQGHVLRIALPYQNVLNFTGLASPVQLWTITTTRGAVSMSKPSTGVISSTYTVQRTVSSVNNNYFVFNSDIKAGVNYQLRISLASNITESTGFKGWIQIETMSPANSIFNAVYNDQPIQYDFNRAFAPIQLLQAPGTPIFEVVNAVATDTSTSQAGATWTAEFRVRPSNNFWLFPLIIFTWDNDKFRFGDTITSVDTGLSTVRAPLPSSQYSYVVQQGVAATTTSAAVPGKINLYHNSTMSNQRPVIYNVSVQNPNQGSYLPFVTTVSVFIQHRYNMNLTDWGQASPLTVIPAVSIQNNAATGTSTATNSIISCGISNPKVLTAWGIDRAIFENNANLMMWEVFRIYATPSLASYGVRRGRRLTASSATPYHYQTLRFQFGTNITLQTGNYTVTVSICKKSTATIQYCDILENSVIHTFGASANCVPVNPTLLVGGSIVCTNIPSITSTSNQVAARIWIASDGVNLQPLLTQAAPPSPRQLVVAQPQTRLHRYGFMDASHAFGTMTLQNTVQSTATNGSLLNSITTACTSFPPNSTYQEAVVVKTNPFLAPIVSGGSPVINKNGPLVAIAQADSGWSNLRSASNTDYGTGCNLCYSGIFGYNQSTATPYNLALVTTFNGNPTAATNDWAGLALGASTPVNTGIDLIMNPNLWIVNSKYNQSQCYWANTPGIATPKLAPNATSQLHCQSIAYTTLTTYTRVRSMQVGSKTCGTVSASCTATDVASAGPLALTFFWEGFVSLSAGFNGVSIRANQFVNDLYLVLYIAPTVSGYTINATNNPQPDAGEISSAPNFNIYIPTVATMTMYRTYQFYSWTQYILMPFTSTPFSGVSTWIGGYFTVNTISSNQGIMQLRVRGTLTTGTDLFASTATKVGLFLQAATFNHLPPTGTAVDPLNYPTFGATRCIVRNTMSICTKDRTLRRNVVTSGQNSLDGYSLFTAPVSSVSSFSIAFMVQPATLPNGQIFMRLSTVANDLHWMSPFDTTALQQQLGSVTLTYNLNTAHCGPNANSGIQLQPSKSDVVNTVIPSTSFLVQSYYPQATAAAPFLGGWVWCVQWDFRGSGSFSATGARAAFENATSGDMCSTFDYQSIEIPANGGSLSWYCAYCPGNSLPSTVGTTLTYLGLRAPPAIDIPQPHYYGINSNNGALVESGYCQRTSLALYQPGPSTVSSTGTAYTTAGQKVMITFNTYSSLILNPPIQYLQFVGSAGGTGASSIIDQNFPYGTLDGAAVCFMVPAILVQNLNAYASCTASYNTNNIRVSQLTVLPQYNTTQSWAIIIWGHNGGSVVSGKVQTLFYGQTIDTAGILVDQSPTGSSASPWLLSSTVSAITLTAQAYQHPYLNARGYFRWDFALQSSRNWYINDKLVFFLDAIVANGLNTNSAAVSCRITDQNDLPAQIFQSCTLSLANAPPTISIVSLNQTFLGLDFAVPGLRIYLGNVVTVPLQTIKTVYGSLYFAGNLGGTTAALSRSAGATDNLISVQSAVNTFTLGPFLTSYWKGGSEQQYIAFTLALPQVFTSAGSAVVEFPSYYNPGLNVRSQRLTCFIDGVRVNCQTLDAVRSRSLYINGYQATKTANTSLLLEIYGVTAPVSQPSTEGFWIQFNYDSSSTVENVIAGANVNDTTAITINPAPLHVTWSSTSSVSSRSSATFTWTFTAMGQIIGLSSTIHAIFPDSWNISQSLIQPSCQVTDYSATPTIAYTNLAAARGNDVFMNVTTATPANGLFTLTCSPVRTPEGDNATYYSQDVQIRVVDTNGSSVTFRSAPHVHNVNFGLVFQKAAPGAVSLDWTLPSTGSSVLRGTYSTKLTMNIAGRSSQTFGVGIDALGFGLWPPTVNVSTGQDTVVALLGCNSNLAIAYYTVRFTISDNPTYVAPGSIDVYLTNTPAYSIPYTQPAGFQIPFVSGFNSTSIPIVFDTSATLPFSDITVTASFKETLPGQANTNFTVKPSTITLTPNSSVGSFIFSTTADTTAPTSTGLGGSATVVYTIGGTNAQSYTITAGQLISVKAVDQAVATVKPSVTVSINGASLATSTPLQFQLTGLDVVTIYWVAGLAGRTPSASAEIISRAVSQAAYVSEDYRQLQQGVFTLPQGSLSLTIPNLITLMNYEIRVISVSQFNVTADPILFNWTTADNGARINKWFFNYPTYPNPDQRQQLFCALASTLQVPAIKIIGANGDFCGNRTTFISKTNRTGAFAVYFYPLNVEIDQVMNLGNLITVVNSTSGVNTLQNTLSLNGGVPFNNILADGISFNYQPSANFSNAANAQIASGTMTFQVTLNNDIGYIYAAVTSNLSYAPTPFDLKFAAANPQFAAFSNVFYHPALTTPTIRLGNLQSGTVYNLWLVGSNNDPSFLANFTGAVSSTGQAFSLQISAFAIETDSSMMLHAAWSALIMLVLAIFIQ